MGSSRILVATLALLGTALPPAAQTPDVPRDLYEDRLSRHGDAISFCLHANSVMSDFNAAAAEAIAGALLVTPNVIPIESLVAAEALDYRIPFTAEELFLMMRGRCDAFMGFTISSDYPDWLLVTRPYFSSPNVLVVSDPAYRRLEDIPTARPIGTRIFSIEDNQLAALIRAMPEERRWPRHPYRNYGTALERALDGTTGGSIVWEAAVYAATGGDPEAAGVAVVRELPFQTTPVDLGIGVNANDRFLETQISQAIGALLADGTLRALAAAHNLAPAGVD